MSEYSAEQFIEAITASKGIISQAAKRLGCNRSTVHRAINKYATVAQAVEDAKEELLDFAESKLVQQISTGNMTAIIFFLKTQGKKRGYIERHEIGGEDGEPIKVQINADSLANLYNSRRSSESDGTETDTDRG